MHLDRKDSVGFDDGLNETFAFVSKQETVDGIAQMSRASLRERRRLGAVFITGTSQPDGDLLGLITAWDVAGLI